MEKSFEELKQEADELGLIYSPNTGKAKLEEKIEQKYKEIEESSDSVESNTRVSTKGFFSANMFYAGIALQPEKLARVNVLATA